MASSYLYPEVKQEHSRRVLDDHCGEEKMFHGIDKIAAYKL